MTQKLLYTAPVAEALVVQVEGTLCSSPYGTPGSAGRIFREDDEHTYDL